jgi:hypothetical protein
MSPLLLSCIIFGLLVGGILLGTLLRGALPEHHLKKESQDLIRLGGGLIATLAALVLGLLIASAKSSFDTQSGQVKQITAEFILLDNILAQYGPETRPIRQMIRATIPVFVDRLWGEKAQRTNAPFEASAAAEKAYLDIQALSPGNDLQKSLQARAIQIETDMAQTRLLLFVEKDGSIPVPFLAVLVFWLVIIFATFSLFSELNPTAFAFLSLFALSAAGAIFLILELSEPFTGLMMISSEPLRTALAPLG